MQHTSILEKKSETSLSKWTILQKSFRKNWDLYLLIFPVIAYFIVFHYVPMYGVQIAFKDFIATLGIWDSPWVGMKHFERFFNSYYFWRLIKNTLIIGIYTLAVAFPIPIIIALMLNEVRNSKFKKFVQTVIYAPHFLSTVVVVGMLILFLKPDGLINQIIILVGGKPIAFMSEPSWFKTLYVFSDVWQTMGWSSIIYLSALTAVDYSLHESAMIDGASRFQRIWHINIPTIMPTIIILFILNAGSVMSVGFEKVFLMQNTLNMSTSDVISTFVYRSGIEQAEYSFSAAVGLFNSIINFIMLVMVNFFAKKINQTSLW
ncbi:sugar ABC transporter permease [Bacillus cereus]|uniref:Sugar ABC transporter permease n=2 Tax=Bacillus TaxID=1386 RepID=A0AA44Q9B3_BACCE|nr:MULTISPECIES: ABC transporter permease subunit [Bacillus cereus group]PFA22088.1 sugar ABC transporter permease [Bacillus cereus]PFN09068.1 sugar ABC transporter permease [Bacillus cereus]PFO78983.1 sugar ABC transporter permease [Bacillus cereus]PFR29166.1 sugar ABC transporter permease [Bacillus cereus]PFR99281.1 sugar ABC transporter permease [Bacillus cereus]